MCGQLWQLWASVGATSGNSTRSRPAKWLNNCLTQQNSLPKGQAQGGTKTNCFCVGKNLKTSSLPWKFSASRVRACRGGFSRRDEGDFFCRGSEGGGEGGFGTDHGAARSELSRLRTTGLSAGGQSHRCRLLGWSKSSASAREQC